MVRDRSRRWALVVVTLSVLAYTALSGAVPPVATAATGVAPVCGQTLENDDFFLTADVGPCSTDDALRLNSARLDMRGHVVKGDDNLNITGITVDGSGSVLENGVVRDTGDEGVLISGDPGGDPHVVRNVTSKSNSGNGFEVESAGNILRNNNASGNQLAGFFVGGDSNLLTANSASGNESGFWVNEFVVGNRLWNNRATSNGTGFRDNASGSAYAGNRAIANNETGFSINGTDTIVLNNTASRTRFVPSAGFAVDGDNNLLGSNKVVENKGDGFFVSGVVNTLVTNRGTDNRGFDLVDTHGDCGSNDYEGNRGKADPACAKNSFALPKSDLDPVTPACGDTLPPGDYILTANLGPCSTVNSLILDSARLEMNGHTVSGDGAGNGGVHMIGSGSALRNGVVKDSSNGVQVSDVGARHIVSGVISKNNEFSGFDIDSPFNIIRNSIARGNGQDGFKIFGSEGNLLASNIASGNVGGGFLFGDAPNSRVWGNVSSANADGYHLASVGGGNVLSANRATRNSDEGFDVRSGQNVLLNNAATRNASTSDPGFAIVGGNSLGTNKAIENRADGIVVGGNDNVLVANKGRDNVDIDLRDANIDCGTNRWEGNKGTRDPACIG